jgi:flagellar motor switch protein FliM
VTVCVEGEKKYEAAIGQHKRMRALRIRGSIDRTR